MTVHGVAVDVHFRIQGEDIAFGGDDQGVDLDHGTVVGDKQLIEVFAHGGHLLLQVLLDLQAEADLAGVERLEAGDRADIHADDTLGRLGGYFLDIHTTVLRADNGHGGGLTVGDNGKVELFLDVQAFFHQHLAHLLALGAGLLGHQSHADDRISDWLDVTLGLGELDAAALTAAAGMHLGLDNHRVAELFRDFLYLSGRVGEFSFGGGDIEFSE